MALTDRKVMTFDVVGTLIDFETGILDYVQGTREGGGREPHRPAPSSRPMPWRRTASTTRPRACPSPP